MLSTGEAAAVALKSPLALCRLPRKSWAFLALYAFLAAILLAVVGMVIVAYQKDLRHMVLGLVFPASWHGVIDVFLDHFFIDQQRLVAINAVVTGSLLVVTLTLFAVKELVSVSFESEGKLVSQKIAEHPLWEQAWEEIKLVLLFIAVQGTVFWLGYSPNPVRVGASVALSYGFLVFTYALDFVAPVFQRHEGHYSRIIKTLLRHAPASFTFGLIFASPAIVVGLLWTAHPEWSWQMAITLLFSVNVITIAWAAVAGTWLGAQLMDDFESTKRSGVASRVVSWLVLLAVLGANGYAFGAVGKSLLHKTQILKCHYSVDLSSFGIDRPSFGSLLGNKLEVAVHFDVEIENPTKIDVEIEKNRLEIKHDGKLIATTSLAPIAIAHNSTERQRVDLSIELSMSLISQGRDLFTSGGWEMILYLQVTENLELPVYLMVDEARH